MADQPVPDASVWGDTDDLDVRWIRKLFFGKSLIEVQECFGSVNSIERADELLFAPDAVFRYYVRAFAMFVLSGRGRGDSDSASAFLGLLEARGKRDPVSVREVLPALANCLDVLAADQARFDADIGIYGDFAGRVRDIRDVGRR